MNIIDKLAKGYSYTHDQAFKLDAGFAYQLILMNYEYDAYYERVEKYRNELNK